MRSQMIALGLILLMPVSSAAVDWSSCASDLERVKRAARNAEDQATEANSRAEELESCRRRASYEAAYSDDGCRSAVSAYQSAAQLASLELDTLSSRIRTASLSCGFDVHPKPKVPQKRQ